MDKGKIIDNSIASHRRTNDILLGPLERPALKWLAKNMPAWVTPDLCTGIGVLGAAVVMAGYVLTRIGTGFLWLASLGFVVNWFGDSLDGTLARHRRIERPRYGFFVDHLADAFNETIIMLGVGLSPFVRFDVACLALGAYLLMSLFCLLRMSTSNEFKITFSRLGPTEMRVSWILFNAVVFFAGTRTITIRTAALGVMKFSPYDLVVIGAVLFMIVLLTVSAVRMVSILAASEPPVRPGPSESREGAD